MNLYQLYSKPEELKWANKANEEIPQIFAVDQFRNFDRNKSYTLEQTKAIAKDPLFAYWYSLYIIRGPWESGELAIMKSPRHAYAYAKYILEHPWPEAEKYIKKDQYW